MNWNRIRTACAAWGGTIVLVLALCAVPALAAIPAVDEAQRLYDSGKFTEAVTLLRNALGTGQITGNDVVGARAFLARCLVKSGERLEAKQSFKAVLRLDPAWRPDAVMVPPDEMDVFNLALKEITAEQIEAGQRVPASLSFFYGMGSGDNKDFAKIPHAGGGDDKLDSESEFGGSVRFPLRPRVSLDIEMSRFRATGRDSFRTTPLLGDYEVTAVPIVLSVYWNARPSDRNRVNVFVGAGPMIASRAALKFVAPGTGYFVADEKVGSYFHGGIEDEYLLNPRFALGLRVVGRSATAKGFFKDTNFDPGLAYYGQSAPLKDQKVDFSGFGIFLGLRAYIGY